MLMDVFYCETCGTSMEQANDKYKTLYRCCDANTCSKKCANERFNHVRKADPNLICPDSWHGDASDINEFLDPFIAINEPKKLTKNLKHRNEEDLKRKNRELSHVVSKQITDDYDDVDLFPDMCEEDFTKIPIVKIIPRFVLWLFVYVMSKTL